MSPQFDVYALEDYTPVWVSRAPSLEEAEKLIQTGPQASREYLVYSQQTGLHVVYEKRMENGRCRVSRKVRNSPAMSQMDLRVA